MTKANSSSDLPLQVQEHGSLWSTVDVVQGLGGVCYAVDQLIIRGCEPDLDTITQLQKLAMAAKVLSSIFVDSY